MGLLGKGAVTGTRTYDAEQHAIPSDMDGMSTLALMQENVFSSLSSQALPRAKQVLARERLITGWTPLFNSSFCSDRPSKSTRIPATAVTTIKTQLLADVAKRLLWCGERRNEAFGKGAAKPAPFVAGAAQPPI